MPAETPPKRRSRAVDPQMRALRWSGKAHTREARLYRALRTELIQHVGGSPSITQRALIDRLAWLQLQLAKMDERMMRTGEMSDHAGRQYLAWANSVARMLGQLGLHAPAARPLTPAEALAAIHEQARRQREAQEAEGDAHGP